MLIISERDYDILNKPEEERKKLLEKYCQGSAELKTLLQNLWDHNIETAACSRGSRYYNEYDGEWVAVSSYVTIKYDEHSKELFKSIFSYVRDDCSSGISLRIDADKDEILFQIMSAEDDQLWMFKDINSFIGKKAEADYEILVVENLLDELKDINGFVEYYYGHEGVISRTRNNDEECPIYFKVEGIDKKTKKWRNMAGEHLLSTKGIVLNDILTLGGLIDSRHIDQENLIDIEGFRKDVKSKSSAPATNIVIRSDAVTVTYNSDSFQKTATFDIARDKEYKIIGIGKERKSEE